MIIVGGYGHGIDDGGGEGGGLLSVLKRGGGGGWAGGRWVQISSLSRLLLTRMQMRHGSR